MSFSSIVLNLQRILLLIFLLSLVILLCLIFLTDPYTNSLYFGAFLATLFVLLASTFSLFGFWITFSKQFVDLTNLRLTTILKQSLLASLFLCILVFMRVVEQLNFLSFGLLILGYVLFEIWSV